MSDPPSLRGHWWFPEAPDRTTYGVLDLDESGWQLHLGRSLDDRNLPLLFDDERREPRTIHGVLDSSERITLLDCHLTFDRGNATADLPLSIWIANGRIHGEHFDGDEDPVAAVRVELAPLAEWLRPDVETDIKWE